MKRDTFRLLLDFEKAEACLEAEDPEDFLYEYQGRIVGVEDETERAFPVGRFRAVYADVANGREACLDAVEVLDGEQSTCDFMPLFDLGKGFFTEQVERLTGADFLFSNLLVLDRIEVLPEFRGQHIAEEVIGCLLRRFGHGAGLVALKASPLQLEKGPPRDAETAVWRQQMALDSLPQDATQAKRALKAFYKRLGFISLPRTDLMIASLPG